MSGDAGAPGGPGGGPAGGNDAGSTGSSPSSSPGPGAGDVTSVPVIANLASVAFAVVETITYFWAHVLGF